MAACPNPHCSSGTDTSKPDNGTLGGGNRCLTCRGLGMVPDKTPQGNNRAR